MSKPTSLTIVAIAAAAFAVSGTGCARSAAAGSVTKASMHVQGLMCRLCLPKVEAALKTVHGFRKMDSQDLSHITVTYDSHTAKPADLVAAINKQTAFHANLARE